MTRTQRTKDIVRIGKTSAVGVTKYSKRLGTESIRNKAQTPRGCPLALPLAGK